MGNDPNLDNDPNRDRKGAVYSTKQPLRPHHSLTVAVRIMLFFPVACFGADKDITLYVSPQQDINTVPSVSAARDEIRAHRAKGEWKDQSITVLVHGGRYVLSEPFALTAEDSGVTYAAAKGEQPIFSGGQPITGWKAAEINGETVWKADIPDVKSGAWSFHQLFVNGQRRFRTRLPQSGYYRFEGLPTTRPETPWSEGQQEAVFAPGDLKNWKNLSDVELTVLTLWITNKMPLAEVDESTRLVKFTKKSQFRLTDGYEQGKFARYYVENIPDTIGTPGQWYLDRAEGVVLYAPMPGETLEKAEVIAPRLIRLVTIGDANGQAVSDVTFDGLAFEHNEWALPKDYSASSQSAVDVPGAIFLQYAKRCAIRNGRVSHIGTYGIELGAGCEETVIENNELSDLGAGGIKIGHDTTRTTVTNNEIGPGSLLHQPGVGIWVGHSGHNQITHNHIHDFLYTGISVGWIWGYYDSKAVNNKVEYNHIHDIGKGMLSDMGGIYTLGPSPGTTLRYNRIHDINAYGYGGWGIYNDEGSTGILIENNIVYNTTNGGYHQHYGKENIVRNNIFAFAKLGQIIRSREEEHLSFTFERNIVYFSEGTLLGSTWANGHFKLDHNCYYRTDGKPIEFAGSTFEQWQGKGNDAHSIVADPLFVNAQGGDFTLKPGSPVDRIDFKPIDTSNIGRQSTGE